MENFQNFTKKAEASSETKDEVRLEEKIDPLFIDVKSIDDVKKLYKYESSRKIDGLEYIVSLTQGEGDVYDLSFGTKEHGVAITNQGMESFNKVVDLIVELVKDMCKKVEMKAIKFGASKGFLSIEQTKEVEQILIDSYTENPEFLNGFHYENEKRGIINIENGIVTTKYKKDQLDISDKIKGRKVSFDSVKKDLDSYFFDPSPYAKGNNLIYLYQFDDNIVMSLFKYIGETEYVEELSKINSKKDKQERRLKLYQRVLASRFPDFRTETKEGEVFVYLDSKENKSEVSKDSK